MPDHAELPGHTLEAAVREQRLDEDASSDRASQSLLLRTWHAMMRAMTDDTPLVIPSDDQAAIELLFAIREGDTAVVRRLVSERPEVVRARFGSQERGTGTALHMVTDWPGYFPGGPEIVRILIVAGADPAARTTARGSLTPGPKSETPLHYAASSDDVDVAEALIDGGADIEAPDGSIGTPLDNAIGYSCWHVARLLARRGARIDKTWHAAALGMLERLEQLLELDADPGLVSQGFWHSCAAGQRRAAELLLSRGADLNWEPDYAYGTPLDAADGIGTRQENVITWLREQGARSASPSETD